MTKLTKPCERNQKQSIVSDSSLYSACSLLLQKAICSCRPCSYRKKGGKYYGVGLYDSKSGLIASSVYQFTFISLTSQSFISIHS